MIRIIIIITTLFTSIIPLDSWCMFFKKTASRPTKAPEEKKMNTYIIPLTHNRALKDFTSFLKSVARLQILDESIIEIAEKLACNVFYTAKQANIPFNSSELISQFHLAIATFNDNKQIKIDQDKYIQTFRDELLALTSQEQNVEYYDPIKLYNRLPFDFSTIGLTHQEWRNTHAFFAEGEILPRTHYKPSIWSGNDFSLRSKTTERELLDNLYQDSKNLNKTLTWFKNIKKLVEPDQAPMTDKEIKNLILPTQKTASGYDLYEDSDYEKELAHPKETFDEWYIKNSYANIIELEKFNPIFLKKFLQFAQKKEFTKQEVEQYLQTILNKELNTGVYRSAQEKKSITQKCADQIAAALEHWPQLPSEIE